MLLVATIALSAAALLVLIRKKLLSMDGSQPYRKIAVRRFSVSFAIALALYMSYRLEVDNQWLYLVALPTVWLSATFVFWNVTNHLDNREKRIATSQVVRPTASKSYQQSPVDRIYAWSAEHQDVNA